VIYSQGKRVDKAKSKEYLAEFFSACPGSTQRIAHFLLAEVGDAALQTRVAADLRKRLATESDLDELKQYETLWGLELRTARPPSTPRFANRLPVI
jgi:hypothetical protein